MKYLICTFLLCAAPLLASSKAVVFDYGNVLSFPDRTLVVKMICDSFGWNREQFELVNQEKREFVKRGGTDIDFWMMIAKREGAQLPEDWSERYRDVIWESFKIDDRMMAMIHELKARKIPVGLLSNVDARYAKYIRDFGLYEPFQPCLLSYEIGADKPNRKAYEILLEKINLQAEEVVFVDDMIENVEGAKQVGIDAIHFQSPEQIRQEFQKRNLL